MNRYKTNINIGTITKLRLYSKLSFINLSVFQKKLLLINQKKYNILYLLKFIFSLDLIIWIKEIKIKTGR